MIKVYGIKTCGSVQKALRFFKENNIDVEFCDFRVAPIGKEVICHWLEHLPLSTLLNTKGTKYKTLGLSSMVLDEEQKKEWLTKENLLIKRPVITKNGDPVIVGFDLPLYEEKFRS